MNMNLNMNIEWMWKWILNDSLRSIAVIYTWWNMHSLFILAVFFSGDLIQIYNGFNRLFYNYMYLPDLYFYCCYGLICVFVKSAQRALKRYLSWDQGSRVPLFFIGYFWVEVLRQLDARRDAPFSVRASEFSKMANMTVRSLCRRATRNFSLL